MRLPKVAIENDFILEAEESERCGFRVWTHVSEPVFIVEYSPTPGHDDHWRYPVFRSNSRPPAGRRPWAVDNSGLYPKSKVPTSFCEALKIARAAVGAA